jgi:hypothetical protein
MSESTELAIAEERDEIALAEEARKAGKPIPSQNGLLAPARWEMFGRIANTVANTEFVPRGLRGNKPAVMACLLYGDAQGLHPSVALTEVHIVDGKPTMSATLMVGKIRMAGHRLKREEIRNPENGEFLGCVAHGTRGDDGETDSFTFTLAMAARAGLLTKHNWKAYPEAMCWARCVSQLARMLFPDVFLGQSAYTSEELGLEDTTDDGVPEGDAEQKPLPAAVTAPGEETDEETVHTGEVVDEPAAAATEQALQELYDVELEDGTVLVQIDRDTREALRADALFAVPGQEGRFELVGYEVDGETGIEKVVVHPVEPLNGEAEAEAPVTNETIPKIMEQVVAARDRGARDYIEGILAHEKGKTKPRVRLIESLEDVLRDMEAEAVEKAEAQPEGEPEPVGDPEGVLERDFDKADHDGKVLLLVGLCAYMENQHPEQREWRLEGILASAQRSFEQPHAESLADFDGEQLGAIWAAAPAEAKEYLAVVNADDLQRLIATVSS